MLGRNAYNAHFRTNMSLMNYLLSTTT
jgi:hypothetical protein